MKKRWRITLGAPVALLFAFHACGAPPTHAEPRTRSPGSRATSAASHATTAADSEFARAMLAAHNAARSAARPSPSPRLPPLVWDEGLADFAQRWANRCPSGHNPRSHYGENMYFTSEAEVDEERAVASWASESDYYDYRSGECVKDGSRSWAYCGHYTQLVWRDTARVGCGVKTDCRGRFRTVVVCSYDPPGNVNVGETSIPHPY